METQSVQNGGDIPRALQQLNVEAYNENDLYQAHMRL